MPSHPTLTDIKSELKGLIRSNSDRGFMHYGACNRVCAAMIAIVDTHKREDDPKGSLDVHLLVLIEVLKLIAHADTSSGAVLDVVYGCLGGIKEISDIEKQRSYVWKSFTRTSLTAALPHGPIPLNEFMRH